MKFSTWMSGLCLAAMALPAAAQDREIEYPRGSLAYEALVNRDYQHAATQLSTDKSVPLNDPARMLNYGLILEKVGKIEESQKVYRQVLSEDEVELILADGRTLGSHDIARLSLERLPDARK